MDYTYLLVVAGALIAACASAVVNMTFNKYKTYVNHQGYTAEQVAEIILKDAGINDVAISRVKGDLTDHYSPREKVLRLSDTVYGSTSVGAIGVAAHECGHAIQHHKGYLPLTLRSMSVPLANIGSRISVPLIIIGLMLGFAGLANLGMILFSFILAFEIITLPVEFNASYRALNILKSKNILDESELKGASKVLTAAAMTYVAAVITTSLQLLRFVILSRSRKN